MDPSEHVAHVRADATTVLAAARAEPDAPVATADGWDRTALIEHLCVPLGWATVQAEAGPAEERRFRDAPRPGEGDDLFDFFEAAVERAVAALGAIDAAATFRTWAGPRPGAWFPRRMAHEVGIHRWDGAGGGFDADVAVDGVDELLEEFSPLVDPAKLEGTATTVHLHATDTDDGEWLVTFAPGGVTSERTHAKGDAAVRGTASDLYLFAWNRVPLDDRFEVIGDRAAAERWATTLAF